MVIETEPLESSDLTPLWFLFVGTDEERSWQEKHGDTIRTACLYFGCCCPHNEMWRSTQAQKHEIFAHELRRVLRLTVRFIVSCNNFCFFSITCHLTLN